MKAVTYRAALVAGACLAFALAGCPNADPSVDAGTDAANDHATDSAGPDVADAAAPDAIAQQDAEASAGDAAADDGPVRPPECEELTLTTPLRSTQMTNPEAYDSQPDLLATASVGGSTGDAAHPNQFFFYLDSNDAVGTHPVVPFQNYLYARPNGGGLSADYAPAPDGGTGAFARRFVAVSGTIELATVVTPHQTQGRLSGVRLNEATRGDDGSVTLVPGGACYWLQDATWDTRRANGCAPFTTPDPCGAGRHCMPTNAIGDDGVCAAVGTQAEGGACTHTDGSWDSECAAGLRCAMFPELGETAYTCHRLCNVRVAYSDSGCPADTHCGGGYDMCMPLSYLENDSRGMNEIDTVATVGEACAQNAHALYCGAAGLPGVCFQDTGAPGGICSALFHAGSECPAGQTAGYVAYKGGIDRSTLFCFH